MLSIFGSVQTGRVHPVLDLKLSVRQLTIMYGQWAVLPWPSLSKSKVGQKIPDPFLCNQFHFVEKRRRRCLLQSSIALPGMLRLYHL